MTAEDVTKKTWYPYFPKVRPTDEPRPNQIKFLDLVTSTWGKYKHIVAELPTGEGKSAISIALARWLAAQSELGDDPQECSTYITTSQIALQDQYMRDYEKFGLKKLYSADNFNCTRGRGLTCSDGSRISSATGSDCPGLCAYKKSKKVFIESSYGILNVAYYLNETYYAGQLVRRGLMIADECHNLPDQISSFMEIEFSDKLLSQARAKIPDDHDDGLYDSDLIRQWIVDSVIGNLEKYEASLAQNIDAWEGSKEDSKFLTLSKEHSEVNKYNCRLRRVVQLMGENDWVCENRDGQLVIAPLTPGPYAREVFSDRNDVNVYMSATVRPERFAKDMGLDPKDCLFFSAQSSFPVENRQIFFIPKGKIQYNDLANSVRPFANAINAILEGHEGKRGIIAVSSYGQAREIIRQCKNPRLRTSEDSRGKAALLQDHAMIRDSVIIHPSMHEGVDLKGELSEFQVIAKVPFPSLGSKVVSIRAELDEEWYAYVTALSVIQFTGRSVRSATDVAHTYILDESFKWHFRRWSRLYPQWWKDALVF